MKHEMNYFVRVCGKYYIAYVKYKENGNWKQKTFPTKVEVGGERQKKKAEDIARECRDNFENAYQSQNALIQDNILFVEFMNEWYSYKKNRVRENTLRFYREILEYHLIPYWKPKHICLKDLTPRDIDTYINQKMSQMSVSTVRKHYMVLHSILDYAVSLDVVLRNVADKIEPPAKVKTKHITPYTYDEMQCLIRKVKGTQIEVPVILTAYYGFRREEVLGLKWKAIDFENNVIRINHTATQVGGKVLYSDTTKNATSNRVLPLLPVVREYLEEINRCQKEEKELCGESYYESDYVCRFADGTLIKPTYLTHAFKSFLEKNNFRHIRFHDLRHSVATNLIKEGVQPKYTQEWLGHSNIATTLDLYTNIGLEEKVVVANQIGKNLKI